MLGAHAPCMFALTGSIDPTHDVAVLHLLEQAFRRNRFTLETYRWAFPAALTLTWSESRQVPVPVR